MWPSLMAIVGHSFLWLWLLSIQSYGQEPSQSKTEGIPFSASQWNNLTPNIHHFFHWPRLILEDPNHQWSECKTEAVPFSAPSWNNLTPNIHHLFRWPRVLLGDYNLQSIWSKQCHGLGIPWQIIQGTGLWPCSWLISNIHYQGHWSWPWLVHSLWGHGHQPWPWLVHANRVMVNSLDHG